MVFEAIPAKDLNRIVEEGRGIIIDLRSGKEYREKHIKGAVNIPYEELEGDVPCSEGQEIILYCERGSVSMAAARALAAYGYRVKSVVGGIQAYRGPYLVSGEEKSFRTRSGGR